MPPQTPSFVPPSPLPPLRGASSATVGPEGTFTETAAQIFARLNERKYLLLQRALLAIWPALLTLLVAYAFWGNALADDQNGLEIIWRSVTARPIEGWVVGVMFALSAIYGAVMNAVLSIERVIWIDSFFDGKNLSPAESLRAARRLFPTAVRFWLWAWFRYWLPPLLVLVAGVTAAVVGAYVGGDAAVAGFVAVPVAFIVFLVWCFFVSIRLRNLWFLFLDHYEDSAVNGDVVSAELDRINRETKTKEFLKYVGSTVGVDTLAGLVAVVAKAGAAASGASRVLDRTVAGQGIKMYGQTVAAQAQAYAKIVAAYVFYKTARARLGLGQKVNEKVYALARG